MRVLHPFLARVTAALIACAAPLAQAGLIALDPIDSGQIDTVLSRIPSPLPIFVTDYSHSEGLNEIGGSFTIAGGEGHFGYTIYDLSGIGFSPTGASIELDLAYSGAISDLFIGGLQIIPPADLAALPAGPLDRAFGSDLASDLFSGRGSLASAAGISASGVYQLALNSDGLDAVTAASSLIGFGFSLISVDPFIPVQGTFNALPRLVLEGDMNNTVPLPASLLLFTLALASLAQSKYRDKRSAKR